MAANFAIRGGADLLIAINAGRLRSMGEPSLTAMLPFGESNAFVRDFAVREILPRAIVPVVFGACVFDPRQSIEAIVARAKADGFAGLTNFPTATMVTGRFRDVLEENGLGFARELDLLAAARDVGLLTIAYTHDPAEAEAAARRGVDAVNIGLGWNQGGARGLELLADVEAAALHVSKVARKVRSIAPEAVCMVEGGPIVSPKHLEALCRITSIDGYIGGSTIDRVPLESAIEATTASFKTIERIRSRTEPTARASAAVPPALVGSSAEAREARAVLQRLAGADVPILLLARPEQGVQDIAEHLHALSRRRVRHLLSLHLSGKDPTAQRVALFGAATGAAPGAEKAQLGFVDVGASSTLLVHEIASATLDIVRELADVATERRVRPLGDAAAHDVDVRVIVATDPHAENAASVQIALEAAGFATFEVPPLLRRQEDLPAVIEAVLRKVRVRLRRPDLALEGGAHRILADHQWLGDVMELQREIEQAALRAEAKLITVPELSALIGQGGAARPVSAFGSEREWILDALRRNRFRRGATADFLGISRKTLYNRMRRLGLDTRSGREA
ncbi:phosphoenolpyruvate hydrolase family protein [Acuticoccus sp. M5D2P5]|nr:phosphoenolpyruvate hydrolase family protein [Acuticoccus kalidii]